LGTTPDQAAAVAKAVTAATVKLFDEKNFDEVAEGVMTNVRGGSFIDVELVMLPPDQRDAERAARSSRSGATRSGISRASIRSPSKPSAGRAGYRRDISVDLSHSDIDQLEKASRAFAAEAAEFAYTRDVNDSFNRGKIQYDFELLPEGRALGLTPADIGAQLRGAFYGSLALRLLRGTNEIEVRVKLPEEERKDVYSLEELVIRTPSGQRFLSVTSRPCGRRGLCSHRTSRWAPRRERLDGRRARPGHGAGHHRDQRGRAPASGARLSGADLDVRRRQRRDA
jgi:multidrug efflux pump subunit AcrB